MRLFPIFILSLILGLVLTALPSWVAYSLGVLILLVLIGDVRGRARYGEKYKFDEGTDR